MKNEKLFIFYRFLAVIGGALLIFGIPSICAIALPLEKGGFLVNFIDYIFATEAIYIVIAFAATIFSLIILWIRTGE